MSGPRDSVVIIKNLGTWFLFLFVFGVEFLHELCNRWLFVMGASCCHDPVVENDVQRVVWCT